MLSLQSPAEPVLEPDPENVAYIAQVAAHQVEAAIGVVAPADRHLLNAIAEAARDRQNLDVEHVGVDLLTPENFLRRIALKELKSTLRVVDAGQADEGLHEPEKTERADT